VVLRTNFYFAVVDEADALLIDECKNPMVLSDSEVCKMRPIRRHSEHSSSAALVSQGIKLIHFLVERGLRTQDCCDEEEATRFRRCSEIAGTLEPERDYKLFEKEKNITLTDAGMTKTEGLLGGFGFGVAQGLGGSLGCVGHLKKV
jgi:preprotein translocase subunit SecA